jgi:hypothetical protein
MVLMPLLPMLVSATARRNAGFKVIVSTILPRSQAGLASTFETDRQMVNTLIRDNWQSFADGLSDIGANPIIGDSGDELNKAYYVDGKRQPILPEP